MTAVAVERPLKVCPCGNEFVDPTKNQARTYCLECKPLAGLPRPVPLPFELVPAEAFTVDHFRKWSAGFKLKTGGPFELDGYQARFLEDLFARTDEGLPVFQELWLILPEGNGKTTFTALVVLYVIEFTPEAWVPVAASARDQAVDLTYRIAAGFVERNGKSHEVGGSFRLHPGYRQIVHQGSKGVAKVFASDAASGDGVDPILALIEELHRLGSMDLYETWAGKLEKSGGQLVVVSTRGEPGAAFELLLDKVRVAATEIEQDGCFTRAVGPSTVLHEYAVPVGGDAEDLDLVLAANPFSGITMETLQRKRAKASWRLSHWRRFTCNMPTRADEAAIQEAEWLAATVADEIPEGEPIWLGLDVAWKWDTTAAVPLWMRDSEFRLLGPATILEPPRDGTSLDPDKVKRALVLLHERNPLETVVMDISWAQELAVWLDTEIGCTVIERDQKNAAAVEDYDRFMEALREGWLKHTGDTGLTRHALNAVAKVLPFGDARFDRPARGQKGDQQDMRVIDGLVAASMVHSIASTQVGAEPMMAIL